jgi:hypothetical protein
VSDVSMGVLSKCGTCLRRKVVGQCKFTQSRHCKQCCSTAYEYSWHPVPAKSNPRKEKR